MKLGLMLGYWMSGPEDPIDLVVEAERLGYDSVWTAEAYGSDAISYLSWMERGHAPSSWAPASCKSQHAHRHAWP